MVTVTSGAGSIDIRQINFGDMFYGASYEYSSQRLRVHLYADYLTDFEGEGLRFSLRLDRDHPFFHAPIAGTMTGFASSFFETSMSGLHLKMTNVAAAALTTSVRDDEQLIVRAFRGSDTYKGGAGDSFMGTFNGDDILIGGGGADILFGGKGADNFVYRKPSDSTHDSAWYDRMDWLMDFSKRQHDKIDLSAIDANGSAKGNTTFDFIGVGDLGHNPGELHVFHDKGNTYVGGDTNGDGKDDLLIAIHGNLHLTQDSFIL
jgi:hypothetical protein